MRKLFLLLITVFTVFTACETDEIFDLNEDIKALTATVYEHEQESLQRDNDNFLALQNIINEVVAAQEIINEELAAAIAAEEEARKSEDIRVATEALEARNAMYIELSTNIAEVAANLESTRNALELAITQEAAARLAGDTALADSLAVEVGRLEDMDDILGQRINSNASYISSVNSKLDSEIEDRLAQDLAHTASITANYEAIVANDADIAQNVLNINQNAQQISSNHSTMISITNQISSNLSDLEGQHNLLQQQANEIEANLAKYITMGGAVAKVGQEWKREYFAVEGTKFRLSGGNVVDEPNGSPNAYLTDGFQTPDQPNDAFKYHLRYTVGQENFHASVIVRESRYILSIAGNEVTQKLDGLNLWLDFQNNVVDDLQIQINQVSSTLALLDEDLQGQINALDTKVISLTTSVTSILSDYIDSAKLNEAIANFVTLSQVNADLVDDFAKVLADAKAYADLNDTDTVLTDAQVEAIVDALLLNSESELYKALDEIEVAAGNSDQVNELLKLYTYNSLDVKMYLDSSKTESITISFTEEGNFPAKDDIVSELAAAGYEFKSDFSFPLTSSASSMTFTLESDGDFEVGIQSDFDAFGTDIDMEVEIHNAVQLIQTEVEVDFGSSLGKQSLQFTKSSNTGTLTVEAPDYTNFIAISSSYNVDANNVNYVVPVVADGAASFDVSFSALSGFSYNGTKVSVSADFEQLLQATTQDVGAHDFASDNYTVNPNGEIVQLDNGKWQEVITLTPKTGYEFASAPTIADNQVTSFTNGNNGTVDKVAIVNGNLEITVSYSVIDKNADSSASLRLATVDVTAKQFALTVPYYWTNPADNNYLSNFSQTLTYGQIPGDVTISIGDAHQFSSTGSKTFYAFGTDATENVKYSVVYTEGGKSATVKFLEIGTDFDFDTDANETAADLSSVVEVDPCSYDVELGGYGSNYYGYENDPDGALYASFDESDARFWIIPANSLSVTHSESNATVTYKFLVNASGGADHTIDTTKDLVIIRSQVFDVTAGSDDMTDLATFISDNSITAPASNAVYVNWGADTSNSGAIAVNVSTTDCTDGVVDSITLDISNFSLGN